MAFFKKSSLVTASALVATILNLISPADAAILGFNFNLQPNYPAGSGSFKFDTATGIITDFQISSGTYSFSHPEPQQVDRYAPGRFGNFSIFTGFNEHNELLDISFTQPDLNVVNSTGNINYGQFRGQGATSTAQFMNGYIGIFGGTVTAVPPTPIPESSSSLGLLVFGAVAGNYLIKKLKT